MTPGVTFLVGDCMETLREVPDGSVQCCVTSPPYYGLRDYGMAGQFGREEEPDAYVARLVEVFREVRRCLCDDGTLWLNLGDCWSDDGHREMLPYRVALALRADGWVLRDEIIWHKPKVMPAPVKNRTVPSHEVVFMLTKRKTGYVFEQSAIREPAAPASAARYKYAFGGKKNEALKATISPTAMVGHRDFDGMRNPRSVWSINPEAYRGAHCAPMPVELARRCLMAGSRPGDTVLDPFGGSGTTALAATALGRNAVLCELNPQYVSLAHRRLGKTPPIRCALSDLSDALSELEQAMQEIAV